jgi:hypothetical protein
LFTKTELLGANKRTFTGHLLNIAELTQKELNEIFSDGELVHVRLIQTLP